MHQEFEGEASLSSRCTQYDGQDHKATWGRFYPLQGQGTLMFNLDRCTAFTIVISPAEPPKPESVSASCLYYPGYIALKIDKEKAEFVLSMPGSEQSEQTLKCTAGDDGGFVPNKITTYWFSFDHSNLVIKYGKGYTMKETTLLDYPFIPENASECEKKSIREKMDFIFSPTVKKVVMLYDVAPLPLLKKLYCAFASGKCATELNPDLTKALYQVGTTKKVQLVEELIRDIDASAEGGNQGMVEVEKRVDFYNFPLVSNFPYTVLDSSKVTLFDLDVNEYMFSASLPPTCVELYSNVKNLDLNASPTCAPDKYKLSDAIGYSIVTPGCLLNNKLQEKRDQAQFGDKNQIYLRVTLGPQRGQSPGIPYVLEIWPKGCGSPIHNHGNSYAVIKVLHGGLTIRIYNKDLALAEMCSPLLSFDVKQGDITWISPNWYQSHKLWNYTDDYCATIQCYQYGANNKISWPYFDYQSSIGHIDEFLPDSDFGFAEMREIVMCEYTKYRESLKVDPDCK